MTIDSLGELGLGPFLPRLIGQKVPIPHLKKKEVEEEAEDPGAPIQRSPSFSSEGLKSQLSRDPPEARVLPKGIL